MSSQACRIAQSRQLAKRAQKNRLGGGFFGRWVGGPPTVLLKCLGEYDYSQSTIATQYTRPGEANAQI